MRSITLFSLLLASLLCLFSSCTLFVSADLTRQPVSLDEYQRRALATLKERRAAFQPHANGVTASPSSGLALTSGTVKSNDSAAVAQAVLNPQSPINLGQLLQDLIPNYNYSAALDQACNAIHAQLPSAEYYGRVAIAADYIQSTTGYYNARQAGNRPACVVYPTSGADVSSIMKQLRKYSVTYAVRSAGHSTGYNFTDSTGFSSTTGVLIDMTKLTSVSFNKADGVARWETGLNWGALATQMEQYGAQVAGGRLGHVGPGLSLGGGISWYSGQVGFASDTSVAFEIVLADGRLVTATRNNQYSDLWWAQKTGVNAFGIVTAIHSKTVPGSSFFGGSLLYQTQDMPKVLAALANWYQTGADKCSKGFVLPAITDFLVESVLTRLNIFEFFYDGTDPGHCFDEFFAFTTIYNDTKVQSYSNFLSNSLTNQQFVFQGFNNALYNTVSDTPSTADLMTIYTAWEAQAVQVGGTFLQKALSFSPVTAMQLKAHKAAGGSAMGIENETKGFLWSCYVDGSIPAIGALTDTRLFESSVIAAEAVPKPSRELPIYTNYARVEQKPILTFRPASLEKYRQIKKKYDPDNFITTHTSGHTFY